MKETKTLEALNGALGKQLLVGHVSKLPFPQRNWLISAVIERKTQFLN